MFSNILNIVFKSTNRIFIDNYSVYRYTSNFISNDSTRLSQTGITIAKQKELLLQAVQNGKVPKIHEWPTLKNAILSYGNFINELNFDAQIIEACIYHKNYKAAKSLLEFFKANNKNLNIAALGKFMKLYYVCNENNKEYVNDEELILSMYKNLKEQYPILSSITAENVIPALSLTKEWKECLNLLENIKLAMNPTTGTYSVIIKAAFENNKLDLGWKLINEMNSKNKFPLPNVYISWLKMLKSSNNDISKNIEFLFNYFADNEILPTKEVLDHILEYLKINSYFGTYTIINKKGICKCCNQNLQEIKIYNEEFNELKTAFMKKVLIGKNIFSKTDPAELIKFKNFVSAKKYDIVIDGLNVAYSAGNKKNPEFYGKLLANVVRHFRLRNKHILVLGRIHMNKWPKHYMDYIKSNTEMFLTQNISEDDPFLLYATMSSGLNTDFLSRDFMRGHLYLLMDSNLKRLFRKWQQKHQYALIYVEKNGQTHIKSPFPYLCTAQSNNNNGWHIPYCQTYVSNSPLSFEPPINWLCIQKK